MTNDYKQKFTITLKKPYTIISSNSPEMISAMRLRILNTPLLTDFGLTDWTILIDDYGQMNDNTLGTCYHHNKTILINQVCLYVLSFKQTKELILHEIAHALFTPSEGHNENWKRLCLEIGGDGEPEKKVRDLKCVDEERKLYQITF